MMPQSSDGKKEPFNEEQAVKLDSESLTKLTTKDNAERGMPTHHIPYILAQQDREDFLKSVTKAAYTAKAKKSKRSLC